MGRINIIMIKNDDNIIELCKKHDISLYMKKDTNDIIFRLSFMINNNNYDLHNAIGFKLFPLIGELNPDVIEKIYMENYDNDTTSIDVGILFKQFGKELGLAQKYLFTKTEIVYTSKDTIRFVSKHIKPPTYVVLPDMSEPIIKADTILDITLHSPHQLFVTYDFTFVIDDDLPIYMEKQPGLLMKKLFLRLKTFLENINENSL